jgi:hypothetical protein
MVCMLAFMLTLLSNPTYYPGLYYFLGRPLLNRSSEYLLLRICCVESISALTLVGFLSTVTRLQGLVESTKRNRCLLLVLVKRKVKYNRLNKCWRKMYEVRFSIPDEPPVVKVRYSPKSWRWRSASRLVMCYQCTSSIYTRALWSPKGLQMLLKIALSPAFGSRSSLPSSVLISALWSLSGLQMLLKIALSPALIS